MGNNTMCKTISIGNIYMRMFNGHVQTLTNVSHITVLRKSLLLLRALVAQGYMFSSTDGGIKVTKGSMTILKGEWTANLYKMIGIIIIGDVSITMEMEDTTRLWHMCLGHMSKLVLKSYTKGYSNRYQILRT